MKRSQQPNTLRARDDGLRRVRKLTWRAGLLAAAGVVFVGARFAHLSPSLPHLPTDLEPLARRTVSSCPRLALLMDSADQEQTRS